MARPCQLDSQREELIPVVAGAFAELGYRRTTTAELARRCGVRENILYRLWTDKKAMFIAAIEYVYVLSARSWDAVLNGSGEAAPAAEQLLTYEAQHQGETGLYRLVFAGLSEADDPDIRAALQRMFRRFHRFVGRQMVAHRESAGISSRHDVALSAWAFVGVGLMANVGRELGLLSTRRRQRLLADAGMVILAGQTA